MTQEQQAYEAGYQRALEEAKAAIGPRFFVGGSSLAEAMRRRNRFQFWVKLALDMLFAIPAFFVFWIVLQYAHELQSRCSECICSTRSK